MTRPEIRKYECPDCGSEAGWWHQEGCPHRPQPYSQVTNAVEVRYVRAEVTETMLDRATEAAWQSLAMQFAAPDRTVVKAAARAALEAALEPADKQQEIVKVHEVSDEELAEASPEFAEHLARQARDEVIRRARELDARTLDAEACAAGPGKFEGADDLELTVAVYVHELHGVADNESGSVEGGQHGARVGRWVLWTDDQGFCTLDAYDDDAAAEAALRRRG